MFSWGEGGIEFGGGESTGEGIFLAGWGGGLPSIHPVEKTLGIKEENFNMGVN